MPNTVPTLRIVDNLPPEDLAMLQALYSRSDAGVDSHLEKVARVGSGKFMAQYYIGYGHRSVGDNASTTAFIEGVSILADKSVQDHPLYAGQECSTRYIDFKSRPMINPFQFQPLAQEILDTWMELYGKVYNAVTDQLLLDHTPPASTDPVEHRALNRQFDNAIHAQACDVARAFLPTAVTTNLSWHTNLRQASDKLHAMKHHPLTEVSTLADDLLMKLREKYPTSFIPKLKDEHEDYYHDLNDSLHYQYQHQDYKTPTEASCTFAAFDEGISKRAVYGARLANRPRGAELPRYLKEVGQLQFEMPLDFGSWRDLQRHRAAYVPTPLLGGDLNIHEWYYGQLSFDDELRSEVAQTVHEQNQRLKQLYKAEIADGGTKDILAAEMQYFYPLGQLVRTIVNCDISEAVYIVETRTSRFVHATLRTASHKMAEQLTALFPAIKLHLDHDAPNQFNLARGKQTITER